MNENVPPAGERVRNVLARAFEMRLQISGGLIMNIYLETPKSILFRYGDPLRIEHLHEVRDTMAFE